MTPQERQMLADLFERVRANSGGPRDPEAEAFIGDAVRGAPYTPYVLAQTALVQQHALEAAAERIRDLEARAAQTAAQPQETSFLGSLGKSLFGGGAASAPPPPPSQPPRSSYDASAYQRGAPDPGPGPGYGQRSYAPPPPPPPPQSGPWGSSAPASGGGGGGFLSNAMTTAAGVAGGIAAVDLFQNLLGGHRGGGLFGASGGGFGGEGLGGNETVINNIYESDPAGQHAQDVLQDQDQDQDDAQDAGDWDDSSSDSSDYDV
jgi:hypothetical protein